ncbi:hypothetical protein J6590_060893 [Homalodisca vitripennis]|nr:hypothetical protein J6590_060893 [Homalodisca vitripennis]
MESGHSQPTISESTRPQPPTHTDTQLSLLLTLHPKYNCIHTQWKVVTPNPPSQNPPAHNHQHTPTLNCYTLFHRRTKTGDLLRWSWTASSSGSSRSLLS